MTPDIRKSFLRGATSCAPFMIVIGPFSVLFGVVATEAGLTLVETMSFSVLVIAGASQFTAVQMMTENAPTLVVLLTSLAVNLRLAMYSASLTPHLGRASLRARALVSYTLVDQTYANSMLEFENRPQLSPVEKLAFYFGGSAVIAPFWFGLTFLGAKIGTALPPEFALDFAVPLTFIALVAPMLRSPAHLAAAIVSVVLSLALVFLPYSTGIFVAGIAAMLTGALVEVGLERRRQA
jgi:predicted branched-subunit amino acid permease